MWHVCIFGTVAGCIQEDVVKHPVGTQRLICWVLRNCAAVWSSIVSVGVGRIADAEATSHQSRVSRSKQTLREFHAYHQLYTDAEFYMYMPSIIQSIISQLPPLRASEFSAVWVQQNTEMMTIFSGMWSGPKKKLLYFFVLFVFTRAADLCL